jgi:hypothetical protein
MKAEKKVRGKKAKRGAASHKPFPTMPFEEALELANAIQEFAGGQKVRRLTVFDKMNKSPSSGPSRNLVTNSAKYGLTDGSYIADFLSLTEKGKVASSPDAPLTDRTRARFELAMEGISEFKCLYDKLLGNKLPSREVLRDYAIECGVKEEDSALCVDIFVGNAKLLGILKVLSGAERIVSIEQALEDLPHVPGVAIAPEKMTGGVPSVREGVAIGKVDFSKVCFFIAPIGEEGSEHRKHSDMIHASFIERALEGLDLHLIRADRITQPGMITAQVIQYLLKSKVVVADLSFHNPNVFYELAIRHMTGLPTVHIVRKDDKLPFDLKDFRTITIDTSDKYHLVASLDSYRSEIANFIRQAIEGGAERNNPILAYNPSLKMAYS